ncbi:glycosyltransferase family 2 protein [Paenibacillus sp. FSL L8-0638]|uniref:glycosyltransferase family 2 protein n=1 Tax=Paenibacillus TaxID=44249 RepID=UPI00315814A9
MANLQIDTKRNKADIPVVCGNDDEQMFMRLLNWFYKILKKKRIYYFDYKKTENYKLLAMLRIRNESLILQDALDHLSEFADGIICYDDASRDNIFEILKNHKKVIAVIRNFNWEKTPEERLKSETEHRDNLLQLSSRYSPEWIFCADADERYIEGIKEFKTQMILKTLI